MLRGLVMHGYASLTWTSLTLLYIYVNVLFMWNLFLLLYTFCNAWSRLDTLCHELPYILGFDLYTAFMTLVDAP
jgi:hypothetical protein